MSSWEVVLWGAVALVPIGGVAFFAWLYRSAPNERTRRSAKSAGVPLGAFLVLNYLFALVLDLPWVVFLAAVAYAGYAVGQVLGFNRGIDASREIDEEVERSLPLLAAQLIEERRKAAPFN